MKLARQWLLALALGALLWLVNPVHTQSVTYIVQRMNSLAAMFYLLAMVCYIQGRLIQRRSDDPSFSPSMFFTGAALACLCGLADKEITATLPVIADGAHTFYVQAACRQAARLPSLRRTPVAACL